MPRPVKRGTCRVCKCTYEHPCNPPCEWVLDDRSGAEGLICSTCARAAQTIADILARYEDEAGEGSISFGRLFKEANQRVGIAANVTPSEHLPEPPAKHWKRCNTCGKPYPPYMTTRHNRPGEGPDSCIWELSELPSQKITVARRRRPQK